MEPVFNAAEQRLYLKFFEHLGISEKKKMVFLCSLLRNLYDAASKLDLHLAPYSAALHCAVSRMVVSDNPQEAPTHRWIRVVDRLGFFTDANRHSERIVNLGLAFAYRHLEADALAEANALLLRKAHAAASQNDDEGEGAVPRGGVVVSTTTMNPAAAAAANLELLPGQLDGDDEEQEHPLPPGGLVLSANEEAPQLDGGDGGEEVEDAVPQGGMVVSATPFWRGGTGGTSGAAGADGAGAAGGAAAAGGAVAAGGAGVDNEDDADKADEEQSSSLRSAAAGDQGDLDLSDGGDDESIPSHVLYEQQPTVTPPLVAVKAVAAVLRTVMDMPDGKDVLLKLLSDGVLVLARSRPNPSAPDGTMRPTGAKADAAAIWRMCELWWPHWKAPQDLGSTTPPEGTLAWKLNRKRLAKSSRWSILINMAGINHALEDLSVKTSRFFKKDKLPGVECVQRVSGKSPMKLTVVVACLLLLVTKEEQFSSILSDLAFAGRADVNKNAPLTTAFRHEFYSAGLAPSLSTDERAPPSGGASADGGGGVPASDLPAVADELSQDLSGEYAAMASDVARDNSKEAAFRRSQRAEVLRARPRPRAARPPAPRAASKAPRGAASSLGTPGQPAATSTRPSAGGAVRPRAATGGGRPPKAAATGSGTSVAARPSVNTVPNGKASTPANSTARGGKRTRAPRPAKAPARSAPPAPADGPSDAGRADGGGAQAPAGQGARGTLPPTHVLTTGTAAPVAPLETAAAAQEQAGASGTARKRDHPNVVAGAGVERPESTPRRPAPESPVSSFVLPDPASQSEGGGVGGLSRAEEKRLFHARVAADVAAAQASLAHLLPLRYPTDAPNAPP